MITENLSTLKIHKLTKAQYKRELAAGNIDENALYLTPDESATVEDITNLESAIAEKADAVHEHEISDITNLQDNLDGIQTQFDEMDELKQDKTFSIEGTEYGPVEWVKVNDIDNSELVYQTQYAYGNDIVIIVKSANSLYYSTDGINYSTVTLDQDYFSGTNGALTYGNGKFVGIYAGFSIYSTDGINWNIGDYVGAHFYDIYYTNNIFIATDSSNCNVYHSTDGITWANVNTGVDDLLYDVVYGNGIYVARSSSYKYYYSNDAITWTAGTGDWDCFNSLIFVNGTFYASASDQNYNTSVIYSTDGINWTSANQELYRLGYGSGYFIGIANGYKTYYSTNGIDWKLGNAKTLSGGTFLIYTNNKFLYVPSSYDKLNNLQYLVFGTLKEDYILEDFVIQNREYIENLQVQVDELPNADQISNVAIIDIEDNADVEVAPETGNSSSGTSNSSFVEVTQSEYNALTEAQKNNGSIYMITDASNTGDAGQISYDNTSSGLSANEVQSAIDEITSDITILDAKIYSKLPDDTDFNDITTVGTYTLYSGTNSPHNTKTYFTVIVLPFDGNPDYVSQLAVTTGGSELYHRRRNNGNWGEWTYYVRKEELDTLNTNMVKYSDVEVKLGELTWNTSANGMFYSEDIEPTNGDSVSLVLAVTVKNFSGLRTTDNITPFISSNGKKIRLLSNVNTFVASTSSFTLRTIYRGQ